MGRWKSEGEVDRRRRVSTRSRAMRRAISNSNSSNTGLSEERGGIQGRVTERMGHTLEEEIRKVSMGTTVRVGVRA